MISLRRRQNWTKCFNRSFVEDVRIDLRIFSFPNRTRTSPNYQSTQDNNRFISSPLDYTISRVLAQADTIYELNSTTFAWRLHPVLRYQSEVTPLLLVYLLQVRDCFGLRSTTDKEASTWPSFRVERSLG